MSENVECRNHVNKVTRSWHPQFVLEGATLSEERDIVGMVWLLRQEQSIGIDWGVDPPPLLFQDMVFFFVDLPSLVWTSITMQKTRTNYCCCCCCNILTHRWQWEQQRLWLVVRFVLVIIIFLLLVCALGYYQWQQIMWQKQHSKF